LATKNKLTTSILVGLISIVQLQMGHFRSIGFTSFLEKCASLHYSTVERCFLWQRILVFDY